MKWLIGLIVVLIILGLVSLITSIFNGVSIAIVVFQAAYLMMLFTLLYIFWKKAGDAK